MSRVFRLTMIMAAILALMVVCVAVPANAQATDSGALRPDGMLMPVKVGASPVLRNMDLDALRQQQAATKPQEINPREINPHNSEMPDHIANAPKPDGPVDTAVQSAFGPLVMPPPIMNFEGVNNVNGVLPPDTQGDVGMTYYVQWVNLSFDIYDKTTGLSAIGGPVPGNALWTGFGGSCESFNSGDPITLYDHLADRWFMSQFTGDNHQCIAVSQTNDPTGAWWLYDYLADAGSGWFPDYPKFGVWPDGYYYTASMFGNGSNMSGVFERDQMLIGGPAQFIWFYVADSAAFPSWRALPSDLDGANLPPAGAPNPILQLVDDAWGYDPPYDTDGIAVIPLHVDWAVPANSTFGPPAMIDLTAAGYPLDSTVCNAFRGQCVPQPGGPDLETLQGQLMSRVQYRNFGGYETLVTSQTVDADGTSHAGVRWYELRDSGGGWDVNQAGTYAPDSDHRWMADAAMDTSGNIAVGYSVSSSTTFPSIRWAGRLAGDPADTLAQGEDTVIAGAGSQTHSAARWGDYSSMSVDPVDDCTFWYTQEYMAITGSAPWQTRIASFKFPSCSNGATGTVEGTVTDASTNPIDGATVEVGAFATATNAAGFYTITVPVDTYDVTASKFGFLPQTVTDIVVDAGAVITQDFVLVQAALAFFNGVVTDAGHGWPLYASVELKVGPTPVGTVYTNPFTGFYQIELPEGMDYDFTVIPMAPGYDPMMRTVLLPPAGQTEDFAFMPVTPSCMAPGYTAGGFFEGFEGAFPPPGWTVNNLGGDCNWVGDDPGGRGNLTGGSGAFAVADSDACGIGTTMDTHMLTPIVDVSAMNSAIFEFKYDYNNLSSSEIAAVDIRVGDSLTAPSVPNFPMDEITTRDIPSGHENDLTTVALPVVEVPEAAPLAAGDVINSWPHGLALGWGLGFNKSADNVWVSNPGAGGGDDLDYEFTRAGTATGNTLDTSSWMGAWAADMAFDPTTGMVWQLDVAGGDCIHEWDPVALITTGSTICWGSPISERGLAYDPISDTFFVGGWNTLAITRFDRAGMVLQTAAVGLEISGLAYNPISEHLFVMTNSSPNLVYVLDVADSYNQIGSFPVPGFGDFTGAGLGFSCDGHLWAPNQGDGQVYEIDSGEGAACIAPADTWINLVTWNTDQLGPATFSQDVSGIIGPYSQAQFRFRYDSPGWNWWWEVDDVILFDPTAECISVPGSLVAGFVSDANTSDPLNGATVADDVGGVAETVPTPDDPGIGDGFYEMFTPEAPAAPLATTFTASASGYADGVAVIDLVPDTVYQQDFALGAGWLEVTPGHLDSLLFSGETENQVISIINHGVVDANVMMLPFERAGWVPNMPMDEIPQRDIPAVNLNDRTAAALPQVEAPAAAPLAAGDVINSWPNGLALGWGLGFNKFADNVWVSNPSVGGGDDLDYEFTRGGSATGNTLNTSSWMGSWAADMAFDPTTGMFWQLDVGGGDCIHEWDPVALVTTGTTICWGSPTSERGLAYDPVSDTFFVGGWNTTTVTRFDRSGTVLQVAAVGLGISGLAYNPLTEHLFVMVNAAPNPVYVLDVADNYNVVGTFPVPGFGDFTGAGLGLSCDGHLWAPNQTDGMVYEIDSGENGACLSGASLPWLELTPSEGVVPADEGELPINAEFIADGADHFGLVQATITVINDTPYDVNDVTVCFTKAFNDMPFDAFAQAQVHSMAGARITSGCGLGNYCPTDITTRGVMARWLIKSMFGPDYSPPPCVGIFADVVCEGTANSSYIEALYNEGVTAGCNADPLLYCPDDPVTRNQMAVFLLRALEGSEYVPPPCVGIFTDVSCPDGFAVDWIEDFFNRGITAGCGVNIYCPTNLTSRAEMGVFVQKTFDLPMCTP